MGAWGSGPFDNDIAADWAGELADAALVERVALIRSTLTAVAENDGYVDNDEGSMAVAAAAVVASILPGGPTIDENYGPNGAVKADLQIDASLVSLARQAITRVLAAESEWRELWEEAGKLDEARSALEPVVRALEP